jgi:predicted peptidase
MEAERRTSSEGLPYLLFRPASRPAPLIVFLHGWGERAHDGNGLELLFVHSLPAVARDGDLPFFIACPQTAHGEWGTDAAGVAALADELVDEGAERERRYLTGISMGAVGTWQAAAESPDTFAALLPVSWDVPGIAARVDAPAWLWIGGDDRHTAGKPVEDHLYAHRPRDERTRFTCVPGAKHSGTFWNDLYRRTEIYDWLLRWP